MTTLQCQTLIDELSQVVDYESNERLHIGCISPYLVMVNAPAGTFTLEVSGPNGVVLTKNFISSDIKTALGTTDNFAHVFYPIIPTNPIQIENGSYTITLSASGYTATSSSFIGWIQQHENIQNDMSYTPIDDTLNTFAIRFKSYKEGIK